MLSHFAGKEMTGSSRSSRVLPFSNHAVCYLLLFVFVILAIAERSNAYVNYTVGDSLGWYDRLQEPDVNYQKWVAGKNFSLGDFLGKSTELPFSSDRGKCVHHRGRIFRPRRREKN